MSLILIIEELTLTAKGSKKAIAKFILNNSRNLNQYTVVEIADKTYTSKASVVRFAKKLGFNGWRDFLIAYNQERIYLKIHQDDVDANFPFHKEDSMSFVIDQLEKLEIQTLSITKQLLDPSSLLRAVKIINSAMLVVFYAESPNDYLANILKRKLLSIGKQSIVFKDDEAGLETGALKSSACSIIISYSGTQNSRAIRHINLLKANKIPVIGITSATNNFLNQRADVNLFIASEENLFTKISSFQSETSIEYLLNVLFSLVYLQNYEQNKAYHLDSSRYLELNRNNNGIQS